MGSIGKPQSFPWDFIPVAHMNPLGVHTPTVSVHAQLLTGACNDFDTTTDKDQEGALHRATGRRAQIECLAYPTPCPEGLMFDRVI